MKIFHISDIHIRLYQRHQEYQRVFEDFYRNIDERSEKGDIIVIAGDVVHSKNEMSPELLRITSDFIKSCADRLDTILILGNHDLNLQNSSRMDVLSPIVELLNHPNLHFWKNTGIYELNGISFSVMSVIDPPDKWIPASEIKVGPKIALHHGSVHGATTDLSHTIQNEAVKVDLFRGYDLVLLGDIHKHQYLDNDRRIAYSSSPIQQNQGESLGNHGFIIWNIGDYSSEFVPLKNDYGYYTFEIENGEWLNCADLPKYTRARVKYKNTLLERVAEIIRRNQVQFLDIIYENLDEIMSINSNSSNDNFNDVEYQNSLICDYLRDAFGVNEEVLDSIRHINREINSTVKSRHRSRMIWNLKTFEFSNMFSYGEGNFINFENMTGVYGLFAPNASGKTSLLSSLSFCLFDKCPVGSKGSYILNNLKDEFHCTVKFSIGLDVYTIERRGTRNAKSVRVDVNFYKENEFGEIENLNGEDRDETNKNIRELIGTYEDFVMISLSTQLDNQSFIEKTQKERKELLYKFLNLSIFEELWSKGKEILRENATHLSGIDIVKLNLIGQEINDRNLEYKKELEILRTREIELNGIIQKLDGSLQDKYLQLNRDIESIDIDDISNKFSSINLEIDKLSNDIEQEGMIIDHLRDEIKSTPDDSETRNTLKDEIDLLANVSKRNQNIQIEINKIDREISFCNEKIEHLKHHKYDPNCIFCVQNPFVIDATNAKEKVEELIRKKDKLESEFDPSIESKLSMLRSKLSLLNELQDENDKRVHSLNIKSERLKAERQKLLYLQEEQKRLLQTIQRYEDQEISILKNRVLDAEISKLKAERNSIEMEISKAIRPNIERILVEIAKSEEKLDKIGSDIAKYKEYSSKCNIYELYTKATSREGVPYKILTNIIPSLEIVVNKYLNSFCDFNIKFEMIDDKNINANVVYSEKKFWPIELSSGMERFIIGQVIRMGLLSISNLPRPNFIAIDEGFGVLDSENLNSIGSLFSHMKENSKLILCISHIDTLKDAVDDSFFVETENGFSRIRYEGE